MGARDRKTMTGRPNSAERAPESALRVRPKNADTALSTVPTLPCQWAAGKGSVDTLLLRFIHLGFEPTKPDIGMNLQMFLPV